MYDGSPIQAHSDFAACFSFLIDERDQLLAGWIVLDHITVACFCLYHDTNNQTVIVPLDRSDHSRYGVGCFFAVFIQFGSSFVFMGKGLAHPFFWSRLI